MSQDVAGNPNRVADPWLSAGAETACRGFAREPPSSCLQTLLPLPFQDLRLRAFGLPDRGNVPSNCSIS